MKPEVNQVGRIVKSIQGRDQGRYFVVTKIDEKGNVYITDGKTHTVDVSKKKNVKHVKATPVLLEQIQKQLAQGEKLENHQIRQALEKNVCGFIKEREEKKEE
ncbi:MAG: RNA-binding protein [Clostridiales bacterium]|nr:RNA-binding protein [Clostridiales bacterium]